jgi:hypothetical protein
MHSDGTRRKKEKSFDLAFLNIKPNKQREREKKKREKENQCDVQQGLASHPSTSPSSALILATRRSSSILSPHSALLGEHDLPYGTILSLVKASNIPQPTLRHWRERLLKDAS